MSYGGSVPHRRPITPSEVRAVVFTTTRMRLGYDVEEVDSFLDQIEWSMEQLHGEIRRLQQQIGDLDRAHAASVAQARLAAQQVLNLLGGPVNGGMPGPAGAPTSMPGPAGYGHGQLGPGQQPQARRAAEAPPAAWNPGAASPPSPPMGAPPPGAPVPPPQGSMPGSAPPPQQPAGSPPPGAPSANMPPPAGWLPRQQPPPPGPPPHSQAPRPGFPPPHR